MLYSFGADDPIYYIYTSPGAYAHQWRNRATITGLVPKGTLHATVFPDSIQIVPAP